MKKYNWLLIIMLIQMAACNTNAGGSFTWKENGVVTSSSGKEIQLDIQGVYDSLDYAGFNYLAGFKKDKEGNNYPYIAQVSDDLLSITYWPFGQIPNDIFIYKTNVHMATMSGHVYMLKNVTWNLSKEHFPRESHVVYSDNQDNAILCYPTAMEKAAAHNGGCRAINNSWQLDAVWFSVVPKICKGELYVVEERGEPKTLKRVDVMTGKVLGSKKVKVIDEDICTL